MKAGLRLIAWMLLLLLTAGNVMAKPVPEENSTENTFRDILWEELMPPLDEEVIRKYEEGKLSREDAVAYVNRLNKTPVKEMDGVRVRIGGFLVPLNIDQKQMATELLLVPSLGACIHTPPPPPNQTVYLRLKKGIKVTEAGYTPYQLEGTIKVKSNWAEVTETLYEMAVSSVEEY